VLFRSVMKNIVEMCAEKGIYVLFDFHHDLWSEKYCGEGAPNWAALEDSNSQFPRPIYAAYPVDHEGYPSESDCEKHNWFNYHGTYALSSAFQSFYDNKDGIRDSFAQFWKHVASQFNQYDNVIGYEIINEPFAGDVFKNKWLAVPGYADRENLQPLYQSVHEAIREVDTEKLIFFEPITWDNFNVGFTQVPGGDEYKNRSVLSYHHYWPLPNVLSLDHTIRRRIEDSKRLGSGLMLTEFDVNTVTVLKSQAAPSTILHHLEACDKRLQSWIGWNYKPLVAKTGPGESLIDSKTGFIRPDWVNLFSRPYAQSVAGQVESMEFNNHTKVFKLKYTPIASSAPTEIRLMKRVHYPNGFRVRVKPENSLNVKRMEDKQSTLMFFSQQWYHPIEITVEPIEITATNHRINVNELGTWEYLD